MYLDFSNTHAQLSVVLQQRFSGESGELEVSHTTHTVWPVSPSSLAGALYWYDC